MAQAHPDSEVIIAGGGPVGLCLALLLSRAGVTVQVFEAEPEVSLDLRASTFHPPTLDMLEPLGVTADLLAQGLICPAMADQAPPRRRPRGVRSLGSFERHAPSLQVAVRAVEAFAVVAGEGETGSARACRLQRVGGRAHAVRGQRDGHHRDAGGAADASRQIRDRRRWRAQLHSAQSRNSLRR